VRIVVPDGGRVRYPPVGNDDGARLDVIEQERPQRRCLCVGDDAEPAPPESLGTEQLNGRRHEHLSRGASPPLPGLGSANEGLIHLDISGKPIATWAHHRCPEAVQHRPGCLVGAESQEPVQRLSRDPVLRRCHVPGGCKPDREWGPGAVEEGPRGHRHSTPAALAPEPPVAHPPTAGSLAARAHEPVGPPQPLEVIEAGVVVGEPPSQLRVAGRVVASSLQFGGEWLRRHPYILCQPHSDG